MARKCNVKFDGQKLESRIQAIEKDRYSQSKVSKYILNCGPTYFANALNRSSISEENLNKICDYYGLDKTEFLVLSTDTPKVSSPEPVPNPRTELVLSHLSHLSKVIDELLAQQKSTNYLIEQLTDRIQAMQKTNKDISDKLDKAHIRPKNNNKFGGVTKTNP